MCIMKSKGRMDLIVSKSMGTILIVTSYVCICCGCIIIIEVHVLVLLMS